MAKRSRMSVLKRQREAKKAEKAALKRERREQRADSQSDSSDQIASQDDLAAYGYEPDPPTDSSER